MTQITCLKCGRVAMACHNKDAECNCAYCGGREFRHAKKGDADAPRGCTLRGIKYSEITIVPTDRSSNER